MIWPQLIGSVEIEERRPRSWNEPRRKRLSFVKDHRGDSGEWALVSSSSGGQHSENEQALWDRRQREANHRFLVQEDQRFRQREARLQQERERLMLLHPIPQPPLQSWPDPRIQPLPPGPPHHANGHVMERRRSLLEHEDDIVEVLEYSSDSDNDQYDSPRLLEHGPKTKYPKEHRSKSRGRKDKNKKRKSSLFSDDSSSEDDFTQGFKAGRMASLPRRPASRRGRSGSRLFDLSDDSFEDLEPRRRSRSKSRGPRNRKSTSGGRRR